MKRKILFNSNWKFIKMPINSTLNEVNQDTIKWKNIDLPHDWLIYNSNDLYETSDGWYSKDFDVDIEDGQQKHIYFDGVYMNLTIFINDQKAFEWKYGYSSFEFNMTAYLKQGKNNIKVKVRHESPNSRWYSGAGIYRDVYLITSQKNHLVSDGIYITSEKDGKGFKTRIETEVAFAEKTNNDYYLKQSIYNKNNELLEQIKTKLDKDNDLTKVTQELMLENVDLWSVSNPNLYLVKTQLLEGDNPIDIIEQRIGYRTLKFDNNNGFFLNDEYVKIHGVCEHHDLGALGAAFNKVAMARKIKILKEMGVNAIRTAHNMPAKELMELADEMGILIQSEAFDMWEMKKTDYDYARFFMDWYKKDVASWVRRDRNHASLIMWSIGNEVPDTNIRGRGLELTKALKEEVLLHDPRQNAIITFGSNYMSNENTQECANELPLVGYNYAEDLYESHHKKYSHWVIYGSETSSTLQSRGIYHFPSSVVSITHDDKQCSSLHNCCTAWGAKTTEDVIVKDRDAKYCLGQFLWTGFDYIGEPTPYTTKNSYFGQIDTAGFKKDTFYFYQAEWTDYKTNPMVHVLPYWDFNEGQLIDIIVYSNAPKIELLVNDVSQGVVEIDHKEGKNLHGKWQVPYTKGSLKAIAYDENGNVIATEEKHSFTEAVTIDALIDKTNLSANGLDLAFVEISMKDIDGNTVENANNRVCVDVKGPGRLIGLDNGDSSDYDSYKGTSRRLFSGKLLAIIASTQEQGLIEITLSSKGMESKSYYIEAKESNLIEGVSATEENTKSKINDEIPIRKIELTNHGSNRLDKENNTARIKAKPLPENNTYGDIYWKITTPTGIESNLAIIEGQGQEVKVRALGDGDFRVRCYATNGGEIPKVLSELEFSASGIGAANLNPYKTISAGLFSSVSKDIEAGKEGSVVLKRDETVALTYKGVDFGEYGSDLVTMSIYYLHGSRTPIEIWEGVPNEEGSKLITRQDYVAEPKWDTYILNTFKLPYRLKGIKTITIVLHNHLSIHNFVFEYYNKGTSKIYANEYTRIYGDTYKIKDTSICGIGNNVSIEFDNMDFGENGASKLIVDGKNNSTSESIRIVFEKEGHEIKEMIVFEQSENDTIKEYNLPNIKGKQKVTLIFLPGSNFDLNSIKFGN